MCQSWVAFGCYLTHSVYRWTSDPEVDSRTDQGFSVSPSYSAVTGPVSLPREVYRKLWIYWEMTSGIFRVTGMLRSWQSLVWC